MTDKLFLVLMLSVLSVTAQNIVVSENTFLINNDIQSSISPDSLTLFNYGTDPVILDSLIVSIDEMEMEFMIHDTMYIGFRDSKRLAEMGLVMGSRLD